MLFIIISMTDLLKIWKCSFNYSILYTQVHSAILWSFRPESTEKLGIFRNGAFQIVKILRKNWQKITLRHRLTHIRRAFQHFSLGLNINIVKVCANIYAWYVKYKTGFETLFFYEIKLLKPYRHTKLQAYQPGSRR